MTQGLRVRLQRSRCPEVQLFLHLLVYAAVTTNGGVLVAGAQINAIFAFGDSLTDTGNNNGRRPDGGYANYAPYGMNYPNHVPTGRFSDGFLVLNYVGMF